MGVSVLKHQHTSLQFSDTHRQQSTDIEKLFSKGKAFPVKTGTESGPETGNHDLLIEAAKDFGHVIQFSREVWVAVDRSIIKKGSVQKGEVFVIKNDELQGRMHDRTLAYVSFTHQDPRLGRFTFGSAHYATKGSVIGDPNLSANQLYAKKIAEWMRQKGKNSALVFAAGDFNMNDARLDWAFGQDFTSMADQLGQHPNTGHGPIDGFIKFDKDGRASAKKLEVLDDTEMHMFTDHFVVRGTWNIRHLKENS